MTMLQRVVTDFAASSSASSLLGGTGVVANLRVDPGGLRENQENVVSFEVKCVAGSVMDSTVPSPVVSELVSSIASLPVVLWVEHREPIHQFSEAILVDQQGLLNSPVQYTSNASIGDTLTG
jgi:hypothetical protein